MSLCVSLWSSGFRISLWISFRVYQTITETSGPINQSLLCLRRLLEHPLNVDKSTLPEVSY